MKQTSALDFKAVFEAAPTACAVLTLELTIVAVSNAFVDVTMTRRSDLIGRALFDVFPPNPQSPDVSVTHKVRTSIENVLLHRTADTMPLQKYDIPRPQSEGGGFEERYWSVINSPVLDSDGVIRQIVHRIEDVTEFVHAKLQEGDERTAGQSTLHEQVKGLEIDVFLRAREVAERAAELARSNAELEQFAYIASHDLQEPLRMVACYVQLLARRYSGKLDQDADEFIGFALDGATRMQTLIADLLQFSRVGSQAKPFAPTSLDTVIDHVLASLQSEIIRTGATISRDPMPTVMADQTQMEQLFQNLLVNALKFRGEAAPAISISCESHGNEYRIGISDNGIGIAQKDIDRIFMIFQRLHGRDCYPGTGIGLAVCKKVVERHHGRLWVDSTPGAGSNFYFTIPKTQGRQS